MITDSKPTRAKQQNPSNYQMAIECLRSAERQHLTKATDCAMVESLAAQTYATLALVDELRAQRQDTVTEETHGQGALVSDVRFVIADSAKDAVVTYKRESLEFPTRHAADEYFEHMGQPVGYSVYRVFLEVVQS